MRRRLPLECAYESFFSIIQTVFIKHTLRFTRNAVNTKCNNIV